MRTGLKTLTTALFFSSALVVYAQTPQQQQSPQQTYPSKPSASQPSPAIDQLTITGCLKQETSASNEQNTPAGSSFVLSDVKMGATSPASAIGLAPQYSIQGLTDVELQKHIGHTVEVTGRITPAAAATDTKETAPLKRDLPEFQASSVKMVSGTCTAK